MKINLKKLGCLVALSFGIHLVACSKVKIADFVPPGGQAGSEIEILGKGFSDVPDENTVTFGDLEANVVYASEETLRVRVPDDVERSRIKVSRGWLQNAESNMDFVVLPENIQHKKFDSAILGITQGYWIMYPPGFADAGTKFPVIYALHGYDFLRNPLSAKLGEKLAGYGLAPSAQNQEHFWIFDGIRPGLYFPFVAQSMMESSTAEELRALLEERLPPIIRGSDSDRIEEVVDSILHYFPANPDSWLPSIDEMIIVMPDGDNSLYTDRLGPPPGRNADGLGAEPSFPTATSENPANRLDLHVTGWYEKHFIEEFFDHVETTDIGLDKLADEEKRRFIMGISMGGFGSLILSLKNPDEFSAVASLSGLINVKADDAPIYNLFFPEFLDIFGDAPLSFTAHAEEIETNVILDEDYLSANNPLKIVAASGTTINLPYFVEIGAGDQIDLFMTDFISSTEALIAEMEAQGISVQGGVIPAAASGEPGNGAAGHSEKFWRTRIGAVLKFFSDIYEEEATLTVK